MSVFRSHGFPHELTAAGPASKTAAVCATGTALAVRTFPHAEPIGLSRVQVGPSSAVHDHHYTPQLAAADNTVAAGNSTEIHQQQRLMVTRYTARSPRSISRPYCSEVGRRNVCPCAEYGKRNYHKCIMDRGGKRAARHLWEGEVGMTLGICSGIYLVVTIPFVVWLVSRAVVRLAVELEDRGYRNVKARARIRLIASRMSSQSTGGTISSRDQFVRSLEGQRAERKCTCTTFLS